MDTSLLKAGFLVAAILLFVVYNLITSKNFRHNLLHFGGLRRSQNIQYKKMI